MCRQVPDRALRQEEYRPRRGIGRIRNPLNAWFPLHRYARIVSESISDVADRDRLAKL